jgi:hypothetical protein
MEPVKGFLGRFLRRRLLEAEVQEGVRNNDLNRIFDWIPKVWQHLNKFLETHSSSDVTIGEKFSVYTIHLLCRLSHMNLVLAGFCKIVILSADKLTVHSILLSFFHLM